MATQPNTPAPDAGNIALIDKFAENIWDRTGLARSLIIAIAEALHDAKDNDPDIVSEAVERAGFLLQPLREAVGDMAGDVGTLVADIRRQAEAAR